MIKTFNTFTCDKPLSYRSQGIQVYIIYAAKERHNLNAEIRNARYERSYKSVILHLFTSLILRLMRVRIKLLCMRTL